MVRRIGMAMALCLCLVQMYGVQGAMAQDAGHRVTAEAINIAGRQRMLTQRMAAAACMMSSGIDRDRLAETLRADITLFAASLRMLEHGDTVAGVNPAANDRVRAQIKSVRDIWVDVRPLLQRTAQGGETSLTDLKSLGFQASMLLQNSQGLVQEMVAVGGGQPTIAQDAADIIGSFRMLTQKAQKEYCMILKEPDNPSHRNQLLFTLKLFFDGFKRVDDMMAREDADVLRDYAVGNAMASVNASFNSFFSDFAGPFIGQQPELARLIETERNAALHLKVYTSTIELIASATQGT